MPPDRVILHVDMDAFFAAIAQRDRPELRGKAVLTGGDGPRGVVTTASYEARPYGCRSAMPMATAKRLCPHAIIVKVSGDQIREASRRVFEVLDGVSPVVQPVSVDEAYLDVTGSARLLGDGVGIARTIRHRIKEATQLTASVGVSYNKFLAKLASDMDKPDGLTVIDRENLDRVLLPLPIDRLHGVGPATARRFESLAIHTVGDLRAMPLERLKRRFGDGGEWYYNLARGIDDRPVVPDRQAKSIGHEQTFAQDMHSAAAVRDVLRGQVERVGRRLRGRGLKARGLSLKVRFGDFETITRSGSLGHATDVTDELWRAAAGIYDRWADGGFRPVRLIGIHADRLSDAPQQLDLFEDPGRLKQARVDAAMDTIVERFGQALMRRGVKSEG